MRNWKSASPTFRASSEYHGPPALCGHDAVAAYQDPPPDHRAFRIVRRKVARYCSTRIAGRTGGVRQPRSSDPCQESINNLSGGGRDYPDLNPSRFSAIHVEQLGSRRQVAHHAGRRQRERCPPGNRSNGIFSSSTEERHWPIPSFG